MLKTIRNMIVGMTNRLRIVMSLQPRTAARERGSSVVIIWFKAHSPGHVLPTGRHAADQLRPGCPGLGSDGTGEPELPGDKADQLPRPYLAKVAFQSAA